MFAIRPGEDPWVASGPTSFSGRYFLLFFGDELPPGSYYVVAKRKYLRYNADHTHVCRKDTSPEQTINN